MDIGDHAYISKASAKTLLEYSKYKSLGVPLVCPCSIDNKTEELVLTDKLSLNLFLCKIISNNKLTICYNFDLTSD